MPKGGIVDDAVVGFDKIKRYVRIVQQYGDNQILIDLIRREVWIFLNS